MSEELDEMRRYEHAHRVQSHDGFRLDHQEVADRIGRWADRLEAAERERDEVHTKNLALQGQADTAEHDRKLAWRDKE